MYQTVINENWQYWLSDPTTRWRTGLSGGHGGRSVILGGQAGSAHARVAPSMVVINNNPQLSGESYETDNWRTEVFLDTVLEYDVEDDMLRPVARVRGRAHHRAMTVKKSSFTSFSPNI